MILLSTYLIYMIDILAISTLITVLGSLILNIIHSIKNNHFESNCCKGFISCMTETELQDNNQKI